MKAVNAARLTGSRGCQRLLFGIKRSFTVATILISLICLSVIFNTHVVFRSVLRSGGQLSALSQPSAGATDQDVVFGQLEALISSVHALAECQAFAPLGGRCFTCGLDHSTSRLHSSIDGIKLVCLHLLPPNCSVLSFGINNDFTFDDAMEDLGCTVHAFDPTMGVGSFRRSDGIHFHDVGIGAEDSQLGGFPVASLGTIVRQIGLRSGTIDYMKLDVESSEWEVLEQQLASSGDLLRVTQLAIEFHLWRWSPTLSDGEGMQTTGAPKVSREDAERFVAVLRALRVAGFVLVHKQHNHVCQRYRSGCLAYIYETHWVNTRISEQSAVTPPFQTHP